MSDSLDDIPEFNAEAIDLTIDLADTPQDIIASTRVEFTLNDIPVAFKSPEELQLFVNRLLFFNQRLQIQQDVWDAVDPRTIMFLQQQQEFWVVQRLLTIYKYKQLPEEGQAGFKRMITKPSVSYPTPTDAILKLTKVGSHMTPEEWEQYEKAFDGLYTKHLATEG